jgi:hypothetical protein
MRHIQVEFEVYWWSILKQISEQIKEIFQGGH